MGRIPENVIADVLDRADMLQIVGEYVTLKRAGSSYKGLCPFHAEKTPSFNVNPGKKVFKCFGCGVGGTLFTFLTELEGWSFPEAVRYVAARVGVDVPDTRGVDDQAARENKKAREAYVRILGAASAFYQANLDSGRYPIAIDYLRKRGVDRETAQVFALGYAPNDWSALLDHLGNKGFSPRDVEKCGLALMGKRGHYDRFRHRIMFPVIDIWGKTLAFSGREIEPDPDRPGAKYINSPETAFYTKGRELYGLHATKSGIRADDNALLVEGNFDVVTLYAKGIINAVAPLGTALTSRQVGLLSRYSRNVFVAFDADSAGKAATLKALPILLERSIDARVVLLPEGQDPDSLVQSQGRQALGDALDRAVPIIGFAIDDALEGVEGAPMETRVKALERAAEIMNHVEDRVLWRHYAEDVARRLEIPLRQVSGYFARPSRLRDRSDQDARQSVPITSFAPGVGGVQEGATADNPARAKPQSADGPPPGHPAAMGMDDRPPPVDPAFMPPSSAAAQKQLPPLESACFVVLSDLPDKLDEFVERGCCQLLHDERLVYLIERVHAQSRSEDRQPGWILAAQQLADELADPAFFEQISTLLCSERAYDESTAERIYFDVITTLQRQWLEAEEKKTFHQLEEAGPGSSDEHRALERMRQLNAIRKELDTPYQRKRLAKLEASGTLMSEPVVDEVEAPQQAADSPVKPHDVEPVVEDDLPF